ncbi:MAG TPA: NAD-dependent epimerase/dehydratase family protein [Gemmatimonadales bacterium]|nr:NAD-dependent epimerase/dehydratase family protein [Gemmatimonadales bacterium]
MSGRILVTGAAGFIGSHVCEALVARGDAVIGIDNFDPFYDRAVKERNLEALRRGRGFRFVEADVVRQALPLDDVAVVVHLAARPGVRPSLEDPAAYMEVNVTGTARVLEAARRAGVARIVLASSSSVYGDTTPAPFVETAPAVAPISPYAASKRGAELVAHAFAHLYPLRIACLRFFTVYGPRQRPDLAVHHFTHRIALGLPVRQHGDGSSEREFTYISDAVSGTVAAADWTGRPSAPPPAPAAGAFEAFNIGGGERVRLDRLLALIGGALGRKPVVEQVADQPGDVHRTAADLSRSARTLGYRPTVGIEAGIREFVRWYEATHGRQS